MASTIDPACAEESRRQDEPQPAFVAPVGKEFTSVGRRLAAWVIDTVVVIALIFIGASAVAAVFGPAVRFPADATAFGASMTVDGDRVLLNALVSTSLSGTYFVIPWVVLGASFGQLLVKIQVRDETSRQTLAPGRAIARWILLLPPFGTIAALTAGTPSLGTLMWGSALLWYFILLFTTRRSATKQGLHDRIAHSVVCPRASGTR